MSSNMGLNKLVFDTANTEDGANVGAYLRSSDGTLLTHTTVGGSEALDVNIVDGINVEVDLSHVDDSVRLGDGTSFFTSTTVGGDIGLDVNLINTSIATVAGALETSNHAAVSVTTTATDIVGTDLASRTQIMIQNLGSKDCYIGDSASVTTANGILLARGAYMVLDAGASINIHGITASGTADIRYFELAP